MSSCSGRQEVKGKTELLNYAAAMGSDDDSVVPPTADSPGYARESVLLRGLQVPTKHSNAASGFKYPSVLHRAGVTKQSWMAFTREIRQYSRMSKSQWFTTVGVSAGTAVFGSMMIGLVSVFPAAAIAHKMRRNREELNFITAELSGALDHCVKRWNDNYFKAKGLVVRVDVPGDCGDLNDMDVSTSKLFKLRQADGRNPSPADKPRGITESTKDLLEDGRARMKASLRGRIVIIPLDSATLRSPSPETANPGILPNEADHDDAEEDADLFDDPEGLYIAGERGGGLTMFGRTEERGRALSRQ
ncbi:MAG: hypothetical protein Q9187_001325 [Circinaria calcarea]